MRIIETTCPNCGAPLKADIDSQQCVCEYCGSHLIIDDEAQHIHIDNAEQTGYEFEKGRQRAQEEYYQGQQQYANPQPSPQPRRKTWLWVVGWIVIFPLPLTILIYRNQNIPIWLKALIIVAAWGAYLMLGLGRYNSSY